MFVWVSSCFWWEFRHASQEEFMFATQMLAKSPWPERSYALRGSYYCWLFFYWHYVKIPSKSLCLYTERSAVSNLDREAPVCSEWWIMQRHITGQSLTISDCWVTVVTFKESSILPLSKGTSLIWGTKPGDEKKCPKKSVLWTWRVSHPKLTAAMTPCTKPSRDPLTSHQD